MNQIDDKIKDCLNYNHHKLIIIEHKLHLDNLNLPNQHWFCGYVSRNRIDNKIKLNVTPSHIYQHLTNVATCPNGITFTDKLNNITDDLHFAGDVIGFDTAGINPQYKFQDVLQFTKELCDQLVTYENTHKV